MQFIPVEVPGSEQTFDCDLAFLAMGFLGPEETLIEQFKLAADPRGNIKADFGKHYTSVDKVIYTHTHTSSLYSLLCLVEAQFFS